MVEGEHHQLAYRDGSAMSNATGMSVDGQSYSTALDQIRSPDLKASAKAVAFALLTRAGQKLLCFPSIKTIAQDAGLSIRCVRSCLRLLEEAKIITTIERRRNDGSHTSNVYRIICAAGAAPAAAQVKEKEINRNMPEHVDQIDPKKDPPKPNRPSRSFRIAPTAFKKALSAWQNYEIARSNRWIDDSEATLIDWFSSWAKCKRLWQDHKCENPGGLLVSIVKKQALRQFYNNDDERSGMHALKHLRQQGIAAF